jgi:uncharacterized ferritin-like protein (DUF455 family)
VLHKPRIVEMELRTLAFAAFCLTSPQEKVQAVQQLSQNQLATEINTGTIFLAPHDYGRPALPRLVPPHNVARRSPFTVEGHAALMHSIAHIEFNAINLALDAIWRFADMPARYYLDWLRVAAEEAKHFSLLQDHLQSVGFTYGDFDAHDGLWTVCEATRHDVVARMALVPRTMEARGLDATPIIQAKLRRVATPDALRAIAILDVILADEVGHVAIGNHWYYLLCEQRNLDPYEFYAQAAVHHRAPRLKPPFNILARRQAGFTEAEIQALPA